ncbi:hypothetical protein DITRI_Ditri04bG0038500 [Diplodiscus trichospermus]
MEAVVSSATASISKLGSFNILFLFLFSCSTSTSTGCCYNVQFPTVSPYSSTWLDIRVDMGEKGSNLEHGGRPKQGDCSKYKGNIPHCCKKDPTVVDLLPGTPYNQQIANCCKGGALNSWLQESRPCQCSKLIPG